MTKNFYAYLIFLQLLVAKLYNFAQAYIPIFLKNYDKLLEAYKLLEQNKIEEANVLLSQIKENSSLNQIAKNLKHYQGITQ